MKIAAQHVAPNNRHISRDFNRFSPTQSIDLFHKLQKQLQNFLLSFLRSGEKILVGISGGIDSRALAQLVHSLPFECTLVHFDHAWRPESQTEAQQLQEWASNLGLRIIVERSTGGERSEEEARRQRWAFFRRVYEREGASALLLAHQKEDQIETILKRVFEGARLSKLRGMQPYSQMEGMRVLRPLLEVSRKTLEELGYGGFQDSTNLDTRFLRGRMRTQLIPLLSEQFGKEIGPALLRIGRYAEELEEELSVSSHIETRGPFGLLVEHLPAERVILREWVSRFASQEGITLSEKLLTAAIEHYRKGKAHCWIHPRLYLDRRRFFFLARSLPKWEEWRVVDEPSSPSKAEEGWRGVWKGYARFTFFESFPYRLVDPAPFRKVFDKRWTAKEVPALFRSSVPLVADGEQVIGEFLSGQKPQGECKFSILLQILS